MAAVQAEREAQARRQAHEGCQILVRNAKASCTSTTAARAHVSLSQLTRWCPAAPMVRHLLAAIKAKGCHMPPGFLRCEPCGLQDERSAVAGGFVYEPGNEAVVICSETATPELTRRTLVHELIHAYDLCRVHMKPENLYHRACTEVRAANLSTDCKFSVELRRGVVGLAGHHRACVKRRAVQSIRGAAQAANKVSHAYMSSCAPPRLIRLCYSPGSRRHRG